MHQLPTDFAASLYVDKISMFEINSLCLSEEKGTWPVAANHCLYLTQKQQEGETCLEFKGAGILLFPGDQTIFNHATEQEA